MAAEKLELWLQGYIGRLTGVSSGAVALDAPFDRLGLNSASAVALIGDLEDWLGFEIDPVLAYEHPTIAALAGQLAMHPGYLDTLASAPVEVRA